MKRIKSVAMLLCIMVNVNLCFADKVNNNLTNGDIRIIIKTQTSSTQNDRGGSIRAYVSGRSLTVVLPSELGQVTVEISNDRGDIVHCLSVQTPTGYQFMIPSGGSYVVTFTLQDGSVYYGEFDVE